MASQLTVVMAQLNLLVGDIDGNTDRVIASAREAMTVHKADLISFPELSLCSYPPEDLLLRPSLELRINKAIDKILAANLDITMVVGYPLSENGKLYNALSVIHGDEVQATYRKQCLPNYQVFDEQRYFVSGNVPCIAVVKGIPLAFTICEDMWEEEPTKQAAQAGAKLLININASPFHRNKPAERIALLKHRALKSGLAIVYNNLVGGQDELVFDGGSMALDASAETLLLAPSFTEGLYPVNFELEAEHLSMQPRTSWQTEPCTIEHGLYQALVMGVRDYVLKNGFNGVVLGLSGGVDSALTLAIAVDALGPERVQAVMMPFTYTSQLSLDLAQSQAQRLGVRYSIIPISQIYEQFDQALQPEFEGCSVDVTEQNIQARSRGVLLMAISNKKGSLVLTTGNKSEVAVGYCTLYGDMAGGFNVLKDVSKTLVYKLCQYRNALESEQDPVIPTAVIERAPSAELAPGQVDQDSLPDYDELDRILEAYIEYDLSAAAIVERGHDKEVVHRILRLVDINEYKRRQAPIGVRLTKRGFGRDRRYPVTSGWKLGV
ncbi:MAG: NAD+ synthase [Pseudohongiellaceae bacterium]|nr:NAD+ synthase [Pseudohongiellaceae bacterium]